MNTKANEIRKILNAHSGKVTYAAIAAAADIAGTTFNYAKKVWYNPIETPTLHELPEVESDKKERDFNWREWVRPLQEMQELQGRASNTQGTAKVKINTRKPICVVLIADWHLGSWGTDYSRFMELTEEIKNTENLYVIIAGDMTQMAIKMRSVMEISDNALKPKLQWLWLESWMEEIKHKVICSTWENHAQMREENVIGWSPSAEIMAQKTIHFNGIGHLDLKVGTQTYKIAVSHFFRGSSIYNPCHSQQRYGKFEGQDRDIIMSGDTHTFGRLSYREGGRKKLALNCGSLQVNSGYAKRFFSLTTHPDFPCVELHPDEHLMVDFESVAAWLKSTRRMKRKLGA
jgi:hypothetical protein